MFNLGAGVQGGMKVLPPDEPRGGCLRQLVWLVVVIVVASLITGFFAARSDGGRDLIQDRLGKELGLKVKLDSAAIGWPYRLVLKNIVAEDQTPSGESVLECREARLGFWFSPRWRVELEGLRLNMWSDERGEFKPSVAIALCGLPERHISVLSQIGGVERRNISIDAKDCNLGWFDATGGLTRAAERISLSMRSVELPGRRLYYYNLKVGEWRQSGESLRDLEREWVATDAMDYILLHSAQRQVGALPDGFWSDTQPVVGDLKPPASEGVGPSAEPVGAGSVPMEGL